MNDFDQRDTAVTGTCGIDPQRGAIRTGHDEPQPVAWSAHPVSLQSLTLAPAADEIGSQVQALTLTCAAADVVRVRGLTDAGRGAFLGLLRGTAEPAAGRYRLAGADLWALSPPRRLAARLRCTGAVLRSSRLFPHLRAQENVALSWRVNGRSSSDAMANARVELDLLGAAHVARRHPGALSAEEHRLTLLARAFAHRPALLLCEFPEECLGRAAIANLRARLWRAAHCEDVCVVLFTESAALAELATTTLYFDDAPRRSGAISAWSGRQAEAHA